MALHTAHLEPVSPSEFSSRPETLGIAVKSLDAQLKAASVPEQILRGKFVIVGIPDDRGVTQNGGHPGAALGPDAFRKSFYKLYDTALREFCAKLHGPLPAQLGEQNVELGFLFSDWVVDVGNVKKQADIAATHDALALTVRECLEAGAELVFVIGGGHDFSYGSYAGHAAARGPGLIPAVNLDAHFDLRPVVDGVITSGTPFFRIIENLPEAIAGGAALIALGLQRERNPSSLYDYAMSHGVSAIEYLPLLQRWRQVASGREVTPLEHLLDHLDFCSHLGWNRAHGSLHLSLDLDVFASSLAPGTSAATPFGVSLEDLGPVLSFIGRTRMCRVFDIAELCPPRDQGEQTAKLAASLVFKTILLREEYASR